MVKKADFEQSLNKIKKYYMVNNKLQEAINHTIEEFVYRFSCRGRNNQIVAKEIISNNSMNFLLEEIAILMLILPAYHYNYIIYPSKIIKALKVAHEIFIEKEYPNLLKWVHIQLKKKILGLSSGKHVMDAYKEYQTSTI